MNQPDRQIHDYSKSILKDKQSVIKTEDKYHGMCGGKKAQGETV